MPKERFLHLYDNNLSYDSPSGIISGRHRSDHQPDRSPLPEPTSHNSINIFLLFMRITRQQTQNLSLLFVKNSVLYTDAPIYLDSHLSIHMIKKLNLF